LQCEDILLNKTNYLFDSIKYRRIEDRFYLSILLNIEWIYWILHGDQAQAIYKYAKQS
jgi:hypothetical protein